MSFDSQPLLRGELLELRPLRVADFEALFAVAADPLIWEQHPEPLRYQEATFRAFFDEALASGGALVAVDRGSGRVIGSSRYHGYDAERGVVEIGWTFLARAYWGGRYNGEMKRLMLEHAFTGGEAGHLRDRSGQPPFTEGGREDRWRAGRHDDRCARPGEAGLRTHAGALCRPPMIAPS